MNLTNAQKNINNLSGDLNFEIVVQVMNTNK